MCFYKHMFLFLLSKFPRVEGLDLIADICFKKLPNCCLNWLYHLIFLSVVYVSVSLYLFKFEMANPFHFSLCNWMEGGFILVLVCLSLMTDDGNHLFMCPLTTHISSSVNCLFKPLAHL